MKSSISFFLVACLATTTGLSAMPVSEGEKVKNALKIINYPKNNPALTCLSTVIGLPVGAITGGALSVNLSRSLTGQKTCQDGLIAVPSAIIGLVLGGTAGYIAAQMISKRLYTQHIRKHIEQFLNSGEPLTNLLPDNICPLLEQYRKSPTMSQGEVETLALEIEQCLDLES